MTGKRASPGIVVPENPKWHARLAALLIATFLRCIAVTLRYHWVDSSGLANGQLREAAIYCLWHNRLALSMSSNVRFIQKHHPTPGLAAMISASRDGGLLVAVLEQFRVQPVRGSSSRRGAQALRELTTWAKRGYNLAITPDGPRGPRYRLQEGIISLAQLTGMQIVPVSFNPKWKICVKSWDRFQIPLPFSKCDMIFEKPVRVPRETSELERETYRAALEATLIKITVD